VKKREHAISYNPTLHSGSRRRPGKSNVPITGGFVAVLGGATNSARRYGAKRSASRSSRVCDKRKSSKPDDRSGKSGGFMAEETAEQRLARLEAENKALRDQIEQRKPGQLRLKVSEKGGLSVYGLGRFPVTLYKEQWVKLLDHGEEIKKFLHENDQQLKAKQ
jgi:hypothetical protein